MAKKQLQDADGNWIEVDDEVTLIHGHPDLKPKPPEAEVPRIQPIHYTADPKQEPLSEKNWKTWKPKEEIKHAGNSGLNDPAYRKMMGWDK